MPISKEMLDILCCPRTKKPVQPLAADRLRRLNDAVQAGQVKDIDGNVVTQPLAEALITADQMTIYRIDDGIPVMLIGSGIPAAQIPDR